MTEIYLIDGSALVYRSFYAIKDLRTSSGQLTNAIYGFTTTLLKILKDKNPEYMCVFFDLKEPTLRHDVFTGYKAQRKPMPEELVAQLPMIKKMALLLGIRYMEKEGYEADDLIATLTERFKSQNCKIIIVTMDKDIMQVLDENVLILNPAGWKTLLLSDFIRKYGLSPEKMPDIIGLAGDSSDNIPGVPGIGEKTALKLLKDYETVEKLLEERDTLGSDSLKRKLEENRENAILSKKLAVLHKDVDIDITIKNIQISPPDVKELLETFERLEFRKLAGQLKELYPSITEFWPQEDILTLSTGESIRMQDIKTRPEKYRKVLEDEKIEKYGFHLKSFITTLAGKKITLKNPSFDFAIARHLSGKVINNGNNVFSLIKKYTQVLKSLDMEDLFSKVEMPLIQTLAWMEINGIKTDRGILSKLNSELNNELEILEKQKQKILDSQEEEVTATEEETSAVDEAIKTQKALLALLKEEQEETDAVTEKKIAMLSASEKLAHQLKILNGEYELSAQKLEDTKKYFKERIALTEQYIEALEREKQSLVEGSQERAQVELQIISAKGEIKNYTEALEDLHKTEDKQLKGLKLVNAQLSVLDNRYKDVTDKTDYFEERLGLLTEKQKLLNVEFKEVGLGTEEYFELENRLIDVQREIDKTTEAQKDFNKVQVLTLEGLELVDAQLSLLEKQYQGVGDETAYVEKKTSLLEKKTSKT